MRRSWLLLLPLVFLVSSGYLAGELARREQGRVLGEQARRLNRSVEETVLANVAEKPSTFAFQGAGSCASQACHNADGLTGFAGREYRIALERDFRAERPRVRDKHAQAFDVLWNDKSVQMLRRWKGTAGPVHPEREALCLRCHVGPAFNQQPAFLADGVSCEACHGPAERWLAAHFRPEWQQLSASERRNEGMWDTRSIAGRVQICLDCHVGGPNAEVNHDLIAAGHPWLHFDVADYHRRWHKHWDTAKDFALVGEKDFERRLGVFGQVASAAASLRLLAERACDEKRPWPEFAELDCAGCHHHLKADAAKSSGVSAGAPPFNTWYIAKLPPAIAGAKQALRLQEALHELRDRMAAWHPDRKAVNARAKAAVEDLESWMRRWEEQPSQELP